MKSKIRLNEYLNHIDRVEYQFLENEVGWQTVFYDKNNRALGGGVSSSKEISARIGLAEVAERKAYREILNNVEKSSEFEVRNHPTTCGFAAGFEKEKVMLRSVAESVERWAWSKWIDNGFALEKTDEAEHTEISKNLIQYFDSYVFYKKNILIKSPIEIEFQFLVFLGFKSEGIFPGSRVCGMNENAVEHAVVEAYRHLKISEMENDKVNFPYNRINFFSKNKSIALNQINTSRKSNWPEFSIKLLKEYITDVDDLYVFRAIGYDFVPWDQGNIERFVY